MDKLNILKLELDLSGRVTNSQNLSLNQCSNNNRICLYLSREYDYIEMSFRKPDGWLSDRVSLVNNAFDENNRRYAYYDIAEEFTSFNMSGNKAILTANIYLHYSVGQEPNVTKYISTVGNLRINVNYVDNALVHNNYSETYMNNLEARLGAIDNYLADFSEGDILVGKAVQDQWGKIIDEHYETKDDADLKFNTLNDLKVNRGEIQDQTTQLELMKNNITNINLNIDTLNTTTDKYTGIVEKNVSDIEVLKNTTVDEATFDKFKAERLTSEEALQKQIDDLSNSSNVKEVIGTREELNTAIDTSKLEVGDRILILSDKDYGSLPTVVKWNGTGFDYVGKYSSTSYTRSEIDTQHNEIKAIIPNKLDRDGNKIILMNGSKILGVSNIELKTVNGQTIFGAGDIIIPVDDHFDTESINPVQNKLIINSLNNKADKVSVEGLTEAIVDKADKVELEYKQNKLTAGANVTIVENEDGTIISVDAAIKFQRVENEDELPVVGLSNVIYLVAKDGQYEELIWIDGRYENLGFINIDLTNYYSKKDIDDILKTYTKSSKFDELKEKVSNNTASIGTKVDITSYNTTIELINNNIKRNTDDIKAKANTADIDAIIPTLAKKSEIPDVSIYQPLLVSGENIKTINDNNILGPGNVHLENFELTDLGQYLKIDKFNEDLAKALEPKADKTELFSGSFNDLTDKPILTEYITKAYLADELITVNESISGKQDALSDTNLKRINNESLLAYGNIELITPEQLEAKKYATEQWVEDKNYLTEHQSLEDYALKTELPDLKPYAKSEDIPTIPVNISAFFNDRGYAVATDVDSTYETKTKSTENLETAKSYTDTEIADVEKLIAESDSTTLTDAKTYTDGQIDVVKSMIGANDAGLVAQANAYTDQTITALIGGAPETLNTLKEISDYIETDKTAAAGMSAKIKANEEAISGINTTIATLSTKTETAKVAADLTAHITDANSKFTTTNADITKAQTQADTNKTAIAGLNKALTDHEAEFTKYKNENNPKVAGNTAEINALKQTVEKNNGEFNTYKNNNSSRVGKVETTVGGHTETLSKYGTRITAVEGYNTQIETNKTNIASNLEKINKNAGDISKINEEIETINGTFDNYYTKTEADAEFLTETGTIAKAQGIVDYNNPTKEIKFTTKETDTEFEISTVDANQILTLLSVMVPNEY